MPRKRSRRRLLSLGTNMAMVCSSSPSWGHAAVAAAAAGGARTFNPNLGGNCHSTSCGNQQLGGAERHLPAFSSPRAATMSARRDPAPCAGFERVRGPSRCLQAEVGVGTAAAVVASPPKRESSAGALAATSVLLHDQPTSFGGRRPFTSHAARWVIRRCITSKAKASESLRVEVEARSNREAMKGRFDTVSVEFQELIFEEIQVTGGARFELLGVDLLAPGFLPGPMRRLRRLRRPCEVTGTSEFTDTDLAYSPAIRRLAQRVINHALRPRRARRGVSGGGGGDEAAAAAAEGEISEPEGVADKDSEQRVNVLRVRVHGGKLAVEGEVTNGGPFFGVPFRYEFSLSASRDGHVVHFKDPSVYWGTAGGDVPLPMLPLQSFNIDLGDRARIEHLRVSGGRLAVGGRFILSPIAPLMVSPGYNRGNIQHDLAETLSRTICNILRFRRE